MFSLTLQRCGPRNHVQKADSCEWGNRQSFIQGFLQLGLPVCALPDYYIPVPSWLLTGYISHQGVVAEATTDSRSSMNRAQLDKSLLRNRTTRVRLGVNWLSHSAGTSYRRARAMETSIRLRRCSQLQVYFAWMVLKLLDLPWISLSSVNSWLRT
jgi:hypothetical protein